MASSRCELSFAIFNNSGIHRIFGDILEKERFTYLSTVMFFSALLFVSAFANTAEAITNGQPDGNRHPYVCLIVFDDAPGHPAWRCTGILLSPTVVLTAGHGTNGAVAARIWVDEIVQGNPEYPYSGTTSYDGIPITHPEFATYAKPGLTGFITHDVGVVVLTEQVPKSVVNTYGVLPDAGFVDTLPVNTPVDLVGYGVQQLMRGGGKPVWTGVRNRMYAPAKLLTTNFAIGDEFIACSANPAQGKGGTAFGDSGGPVLLQGTDTVLAITSFGTNYNCAGIGYYYRIDQAEILEWIYSFLSPS